MSLITTAAKFMTDGSKYRVVLKGKQLQMLPAKFAKLTERVQDPVVHLGINGRGAEGSVYGLKVFAKGNKQPVAAAAGRIDYSDTNPLLQVRGFVRKNTGTGDAFRANIHMDTNKGLNADVLDELSISKVKGDVSIKANSPALKADIKGNIPAIEELTEMMGAKKGFDLGCTKLGQQIEFVRKNVIQGLNHLNPFPKTEGKVISKKMTTQMPTTETGEITKYLAEARKKEINLKIPRLKGELASAKDELASISKAFSNAKTEDEKLLLADRYDNLLQHIKKMTSELDWLGLQK